jgi:phosphohistidine phosphatase
MILLIMRHGIAEDQPHLLNDGDAGRRLTQVGRHRVEEMADLLKTLRLVPTNFLTSPRIRALETARIVRQRLAPKAAIEQVESLNFSGSWEALKQDLMRFEKVKTNGEEIVLTSGHEPLCSEFLGAALAPDYIDVPFKKAAVAVLQWKSLINEDQARLLGFLTPRMARV